MSSDATVILDLLERLRISTQRRELDWCRAKLGYRAEVETGSVTVAQYTPGAFSFLMEDAAGNLVLQENEISDDVYLSSGMSSFSTAEGEIERLYHVVEDSLAAQTAVQARKLIDSLGGPVSGQAGGSEPVEFPVWLVGTWEVSWERKGKWQKEIADIDTQGNYGVKGRSPSPVFVLQVRMLGGQDIEIEKRKPDGSLYQIESHRRNGPDHLAGQASPDGHEIRYDRLAD